MLPRAASHNAASKRGSIAFVRLALGEASGGTTDAIEIDARDQRLERYDRLDRVRGSQARQKRAERESLDAALAQLGHGQRTEALGEAAAALVGQQRQVRELRHGRTHGTKDLDLGAGIGDVILATHDMGDGEVDVVDH